MLPVLIVEDQAAVAKSLEVLFDLYGLETVCARTADEALEAVSDHKVGVVVQDMNFSAGRTDGVEGVDLFRAMRKADPALPVVLITAWTSLETAVALVKEGAVDYMAKPWDDAKLVARVRRAMTERTRAEDDRTVALRRVGMVCESPAMLAVVDLALQVASSNAPLLITGPNGVGKEKIADLVQVCSGRASEPYVKVNTAALPDELLEAELFGAERGAFTGSERRRVGRFEAANGGTLLLDEIGNLSPAGQRKLLRVLQSGEFERVGSSETREVDVRILAATNEDLGAAVRAGRFREDLLFRLNVIELEVPPLAERQEDILPLTLQFIRDAVVEAGAVDRSLSPDAERALLRHGWPGNVRELANRVRRAVLVSRARELTPADLGLDGAGAATPRMTEQERSERDQIEAALVAANGVVADAARALGLSRQALYRRMNRFGLAVERIVGSEPA